MPHGPKVPRNDICGIDEAGRGPLAGPVTAAAVILPSDFPTAGLNDSKKLRPKRREQLRADLIAGGAAFGLGHASPQEIDRLNIHHATLLAMRRAWEALAARFPEMLGVAVQVDGRFCPDVPVSCSAVVKGDATVPAIMAASILAKTERDHIMQEYHARWPVYDFAANVGYPTATHRAALRVHGATPIHRHSFRGVDGP